MKLVIDEAQLILNASRPVRGAWIETQAGLLGRLAAELSRPVRGAWIETISSLSVLSPSMVAPRAGRVD